MPDREALGFFALGRAARRCRGGAAAPAGGTGSARPCAGPRRTASPSTSRSSRTSRTSPACSTASGCYLSVGHDEYWTWGMREAFDAHTAAGGNAAILSGNTCYWQVRIDDDRPDDDRATSTTPARTPCSATADERFLSGAWVDRRDRPAGDRDDRAHVQPRRLLAVRPRRPARERRLHGLAARALGLRGHRPRVRRRARARRRDRRLRGRRVRPDHRPRRPARSRPTATARPTTLEVLATAPAQLWSQDAAALPLRARAGRARERRRRPSTARTWRDAPRGVPLQPRGLRRRSRRPAAARCSTPASPTGRTGCAGTTRSSSASPATCSNGCRARLDVAMRWGTSNGACPRIAEHRPRAVRRPTRS